MRGVLELLEPPALRPAPVPLEEDGAGVVDGGEKLGVGLVDVVWVPP